MAYIFELKIVFVQKKQNVLEKIIIPRTQVTIQYILSELEELEREEFFRLKKVLEVKYRHKKKQKKSDEEPCPMCAMEKMEGDGMAPPPAEPEPPIELSCVVCEGPMYSVGVKKRLTEEQRKQENAVLAELKENLGKVLDATSEYEKTVKEKDSVKEFKQTAERLRRKLRVPPACIPDNVDVEKLCDLCKDMFNEQLSNTNCAACSEPIIVKDKELAAAKESKKQLSKQLETILGVIRDYERDGMQDEKLKEFKKTAAELKNKLQGPPIPKNVNVNKLCNTCKERVQERDDAVSKTSSKAKVSIKEPSESSAKSVASVASNTPSSGQNSSDIPLGVFETEEITEIIQVRNPDGTISEKRRIITIRRKPGPSASTTSSFKDRKSVGHVVVEHRRGLMDRLPRDVHSEYAITSLPMADRMVKACISSNFGFNFEEVLESITELAPKPALETHSSQSNADEAEIVKNFVSTGSSPEDPEEDDDPSESKISEETPKPHST